MSEPTKGYLLDLVTQERLEFQFNPAEFSIRHGASFAEHTPQGGSHPRQHYQNGEGRPFRLTLQCLRDSVDGGDIAALWRRLEALPAADYDTDGRLLRGPHAQRLVWGTWRSLRVLVKSVDLSHGEWFDPVTLQPGGLTAVLDFLDAPVTDLGRSDILGGA